MIDKQLTDKTLQFELSIGNSGNSLEGHGESVRRPQDLEMEDLGMFLILEISWKDCKYLRIT